MKEMTKEEKKIDDQIRKKFVDDLMKLFDAGEGMFSEEYLRKHYDPETYEKIMRNKRNWKIRNILEDGEI